MFSNVVCFGAYFCFELRVTKIKEKVVTAQNSSISMPAIQHTPLSHLHLIWKTLIISKNKYSSKNLLKISQNSPKMYPKLHINK